MSLLSSDHTLPLLEILATIILLTFLQLLRVGQLVLPPPLVVELLTKLLLL
jgi:hypothetical protein